MGNQTRYLHLGILSAGFEALISRRMSNPHLRATLADVLEAILPIEEHLDEDNNFLDATIGFKHTNHLTVSVFQLFVDIEFTGSVGC